MKNLLGCLAILGLACGGDNMISVPGSGLVGSGCAKAADCATGLVCGFPTADACAAKGVCVQYPIPGTAHCNSIVLMCGCDGSKVGVACDFPAGYAPAPITGKSAVTCP